MKDKRHMLTTLRQEFDRWEELLASMSEEQITAPQLPSKLSIKDEIAHLWAWQQRSIARVEAALRNREPEFPEWPAGLDPESRDDVDRINAWIFETYREQPWSSVHRDWSAGFLRFLDLTEAVPEESMSDERRYPWLEGHPLSLYLVASCEHHQEHRELLLARLRHDGTMHSPG